MDNSFTTRSRCCSCCLKRLPIGSYSKCSKCKAFAYCGKECQEKHWKLSHKRVCKAPLIYPIPLPPEYNSDTNGSQSELDRLYSYLLLTPCETQLSNQTDEQWYGSVMGVEDTSVLYRLLNSLLCSGIDREKSSLSLSEYIAELNSVESEGINSISRGLRLVLGDLCKELGWNSVVCESIPGYTQAYDGYDMYMMYDSTSALEVNWPASLLFMKPFGQLRGNCIVFNVQYLTHSTVQSNAEDANSNIGQHNKSEPNGSPSHSSIESPVPYLSMLQMTRRHVLNAAAYHNECNSKGCLPERIHFHNILNQTAAQTLRREMFITS